MRTKIVLENLLALIESGHSEKQEIIRSLNSERLLIYDLTK